MEKYGFVYIWYDRKHKRYYIGCHWGTEDDGYICSSRHMRNAYKRRPLDFKRRILKRVYTNRKDLFAEEYNYLSSIKDNELGKKYYNISVQPPDHHWSTDEQKYKSSRQKMKDSWTLERREHHSKMKRGDLNPMKDPEVAKRALESKKKNNPDLGIWGRGRSLPEEVYQKHSQRMKGRRVTPEGFISPNKGKKLSAQKRATSAKTYHVIDPDGNEYDIFNLKDFIKSKNFSMSIRNYIKAGKSYRGYMITRDNIEREGGIYEIKYPNGEVNIINNLGKWCKERGWNTGGPLTGIRRGTGFYKGFIFTRLNKLAINNSKINV